MAKGNSSGIPVLMYHALEDDAHPSGATDAGEQLYVLEVSSFREQMSYLHREGYRAFLLEELRALGEWPDKAIVLTFDDGHESNSSLALPILQECGFKAKFFITTGWIGTPNFMNKEQIRGLHRAGMGIGSHGVTHRFLSDLPEAEVRAELIDSKTVLEGACYINVVSRWPYEPTHAECGTNERLIYLYFSASASSTGFRSYADKSFNRNGCCYSRIFCRACAGTRIRCASFSSWFAGDHQGYFG